MARKENPSCKALDWLLETGDPGVRYLALRDLVKAGGKELAKANEKAHSAGPVAEVLSKMDKDGFWVKPGQGYNPKYNATVLVRYSARPARRFY